MGTFTTTSDVDIALFGNDLTMNDQAVLSDAMAELSIPQRVDILIHHRIESQALLDHIRRHGVEWFARHRQTWRTSAMVGDWRITTLGDGPLEIIDGDRGKNYPKQEDFELVGHCLFLNAGNVTTSGFNFSDCAFISAEKDAALRKGKLHRYDIVLTTRGTVGNVAYFDDSIQHEHIRINSGMVIFRAREQELYPRYLYMFLRSYLFRVQVESLCTGSAQPQLPIRDINRVEIPLPPIKEQQAIACILGALDDKIELNRRMNRTLEETARAIFKSWFVDFDPVRAKAAGQQPPGLKPEIAALFPDAFDDSELGKIPKGWKVWSVGHVCEFAYGKALKADQRQAGQVPVMGSNGQVGLHNEALVKGPGIVVGRKGNPGIITWVNSDFFPIDTTFYVVPRSLVYPFTYLAYALENLNLASLGADSAVPGLNRNIAYKSLILIPDHKILEIFDAQSSTIRHRQSASEQETSILAAIRDTLLPKLISGELRVPDAERIVGRTL